MNKKELKVKLRVDMLILEMRIRIKYFWLQVYQCRAYFITVENY